MFLAPLLLAFYMLLASLPFLAFLLLLTLHFHQFGDTTVVSIP
jgi:hypothetical protein